MVLGCAINDRFTVHASKKRNIGMFSVWFSRTAMGMGVQSFKAFALCRFLLSLEYDNASN
jgi:hypothetical protein